MTNYVWLPALALLGSVTIHGVPENVAQSADDSGVSATFEASSTRMAEVDEEDCYFGGPNISSDGMIIIDHGTSGTSLNSGCDGCSVRFVIEVIWLEGGEGGIVDPDLNETWFNIAPWDTTRHISHWSFGCGSEIRVDAIGPNSGGTVQVSCTECQ